MSLIIFLIVGGVAGFLANRIMGGKDDLVFGIGKNIITAEEFHLLCSIRKYFHCIICSFH